MNEQAEAIKDQRMAEKVIAEFLYGLGPLWTQEARDNAAKCLIARLASHNPPLLVCTEDEIKE